MLRRERHQERRTPEVGFEERKSLRGCRISDGGFVSPGDLSSVERVELCAVAAGRLGDVEQHPRRPLPARQPPRRTETLNIHQVAPLVFRVDELGWTRWRDDGAEQRSVAVSARQLTPTD